MNLADVTASLKSRRAARDLDKLTAFHVVVNGQIVGGECNGCSNLYVKYDFIYGPNWTILQGVEKGISQIASRREGSSDTRVVWNFPIDIVFKSTTAFGWPRLVISVFGLDFLGRDIAKGYSTVLIPTMSGRHRREVSLFKPIEPSLLQSFMSWLRGTQPEFYDSKFAAKPEGRDQVQAQSAGFATVNINVVTRGMKQLGYEDGTRPPETEHGAATAKAPQLEIPSPAKNENSRTPLSPVN